VSVGACSGCSAGSSQRVASGAERGSGGAGSSGNVQLRVWVDG
jgi:hypothetical protein